MSAFIVIKLQCRAYYKASTVDNLHVPYQCRSNMKTLDPIFQFLLMCKLKELKSFKFHPGNCIFSFAQMLYTNLHLINCQKLVNILFLFASIFVFEISTKIRVPRNTWLSLQSSQLLSEYLFYIILCCSHFPKLHHLIIFSSPEPKVQMSFSDEICLLTGKK